MSLYRKVLPLVLLLAVAAPNESPAPFIWRPGEGWRREGNERLTTPDRALDHAAELQANEKYDDAIRVYRRILKQWPTTSVAPRAQKGLAEVLEAQGYLYKAFEAYQALLDTYPEDADFAEVLRRQFQVGVRLFEGERQRVWKVRAFPDVEKAAEVFDQIVRNGPYSGIAPRAQYGIGATWQKRRNWIEAADAFQKVIDNYPDSEIAAEARYQLGICYYELSSGAHYDQDSSRQAVAAFAAFLARHPDHALAPSARQHTAELWERQAQGVFSTAAFYESQRQDKAAIIYYRKVVEDYPETSWAQRAGKALDRLLAEES